MDITVIAKIDDQPAIGFMLKYENRHTFRDLVEQLKIQAMEEWDEAQSQRHGDDEGTTGDGPGDIRPEDTEPNDLSVADPVEGDASKV